MIVHYRGFTLTPEMIDKLLTHALNSIMGNLPPTKPMRAPKAAPKRRATRPPMSVAERKMLSKRMKDMWKKRRAQGKDGRLDT